jgi:hypothetical protein
MRLNLKTKAFLALLALVLALAPGVILADTSTTTFDTNAVGTIYFGSGNSNGDFATTTYDFTAGGWISLSLRGAVRTVGPITPSGNDYVCSVSGIQICNFEFSVATGGGLDLGNFNYSITIDDLSTLQSRTYDPLTFNTNTYWYSGGATLTPGSVDNSTGFQNSEMLMALPAAGYALLNSGDKVALYLTATDKTGGQTATVDMGFNTPVPEPGVVILLLTMMVPLGLLTRRKNLS